MLFSIPAEKGSMRIFFSYAKSDAAFALKLATDLRAAGVGVWMDQLDIRPGDHWDTTIEKALNECPAFLLVLSSSSVASTNVADEINFALEERKAIVPIVIDECKIPFRLRRLQHIDFRSDYAKGLALSKAHINSLLTGLEETGAPKAAINLEETMISPDPSELAGARVVIYWHRMGLTQEIAQDLSELLQKNGVETDVHQHYSPDPPNALFISERAPAGLVRMIVKFLADSVRYVFPIDYPDSECGAPSPYVVSAGLRAAHNLEERGSAGEPYRVTPIQFDHLVQSGISQAEFQKRLREIAPPRR
jgi:hypothetical protein